MLCAKCVSIFQDPSLEGLHHKDLPSLEKAAAAGCRICLHLTRQRNHYGLDEEGKDSSDFMLRYLLEYKDDNHDQWRLSFENSQPPWAQITFLSVHVCESYDMPSSYHEFIIQTTQDLDQEPWRVRNDAISPTSITYSSGDEKVAATAQVWLERCRRSHDSCLQAMKGRRQDWCPKRLIAVQDATCGWRVVLREELKNREAVEYASLSHCWGPTPSFLMLTSENLQVFCKGMMDEDLPRSFLDAVITTRRLKIEYIWIDSLCILQSGEGSETDWLENAAEMALIYTNSDLNLSIDHASCPSAGAFVKRDPKFLQPCYVWSPVLTSTCPRWRRPRQIPRESTYGFDSQTWVAKNLELIHAHDKESVTVDMVARLCTIFAEPDFRTSFMDLPLTKRAWVFQERLMSPRILHFTSDRIGWECLEIEWLTEYLPEGLPCSLCHFEPMIPSAFDMNCLIQKSLLEDRNSFSDRQLWVRSAWWDTIREYTSRELSYPLKDKLIAFAAVAKKWASVLDGGYYAGMFRSDLPVGLLWRPNRYNYRRHRPAQYQAPSWSWASMDGEILNDPDYNAKTITEQVETSNINVGLRDSNEPYGQVKVGVLTLWGVLLPWFSNGDLPERDSETYGKLSDRCQKDPLWEFTFHHSILDQDVSFMFDEPFYRPPTRELLRLLPIREYRFRHFERGYTTGISGLIIVQVGDGTYARVGRFKTNKEGAKSMIGDMELRERIDIV